MAMCTTIPARAAGIFLLVIAYGLQEGMKARIECLSLVYRLKACLKGLPQFLSRRLHGPSPLRT
jgi:hypothetical protein